MVYSKVPKNGGTDDWPSREWQLNLEVASVPEPSILALFAAGLFGIGFVRRRKA